MPGFTVDPESFGPLAGQLRQAAAALDPAWQPVKTQSEALQYGRGDDLLSPLIQVSLQGAVGLVDSCIRTSSVALEDYASGLESMGRTYTEVEQTNTSMMKPA